MTVGAVIHRVLRERVPLMGSVVAVQTTEPVFVMTFDDGPDPPHTERVLDALRARGAHATFFMLSRRAQRYPSLVSAMVSEGHEIGLHGIDHRALTDFTAAEVTRRTQDGRAELEDVAGVPVRWMRPPYGRQSARSYRAVVRAGMTPVMWGGTSLDSADVSTAVRIASALRAARPGVILLGHDGRAGRADGADDGEIPAFDRGALTSRILDAYAERGLTATSLARASTLGRAHRGAWFG